LEQKLECLDQDTIKVHHALELANEEIAHQKVKLADSSEMQKSLDQERENHHNLELDSRSVPWEVKHFSTRWNKNKLCIPSVAASERGED